MKLRIILAIIVLLLTLIVCTLYFSKGGPDETPAEVTDFSTIGTPTTFVDTTFTSLLMLQPSATQKKVLENIYLDEYYIYPCTLNNVATDVVVLVAEYKPGATGINTFEAAEVALKSFETEMYPNWGHLVYKEAFNPAVIIRNFTDEPVSDPEVLSESYRVGVSADGKTKLYYGWVLNYVFVAASKECLVETMKRVYSIH